MEYIFTERAHLMCPHMHFGIALAVNQPYDEAKIRKAAEDLSAAHPFLSALLGFEPGTNAFYYDVTDGSKTEILFMQQEISGIDAPEVMEEYQKLTCRDWNLFEEGMLKIAAWKAAEKTCFLMVFHHLLADGRGALRLSEELADDYAFGILPKAVPEKLISSADDFPKDSRLPFISRLLVKKANKDWKKENRTLSYTKYHAFADDFLKNDPVEYSLDTLGSDELEGVRTACRGNKVSVNDWLTARMMLEEQTGKVIMACDLRPRLSCYQDGALGNYSTAFSVELKKKEEDLYALAKEVHLRVQRKMNRPSELYLVLQCCAAMEPGLLDAALISCRGDFASKSGRFIGSMFFGFASPEGYSISNLGRVESSSIEEAYFIPPASPAVKEIWGVLTVNNRMTICTAKRNTTSEENE